MTFIRNLNDKLVSKLEKEDLYQLLFDDIKKGDVFPAIRKEEIHFYYKGGRLFKYGKNGFSTNVKYTTVIYKEQEKNNQITCEPYTGDISKSVFKNGSLRLINDFKEGYKEIKELCKLYAEQEAAGLSNLFKKYSYVASNENLILLDIEVNLKSIDKDKKNDKFDAIVFDKEKKEIFVVETKLYTNAEILGEQAPVIDQIARYENNIIQSKPNILKEYQEYIKIVNKLFGLNLESPILLHDKVSLWVYSYNDADAKSSRFKNICKNLRDKGIHLYTAGELKNINPRESLHK